MEYEDIVYHKWIMQAGRCFECAMPVPVEKSIEYIMRGKIMCIDCFINYSTEDGFIYLQSYSYSIIDEYNAQIESWVNGNPYHVTRMKLCCPDFSCCVPELLTSLENRLRFQKAYIENDITVMDSMLTWFTIVRAHMLQEEFVPMQYDRTKLN